MEDVLILDKHMQPVGFTDWTVAVKLSWEQVATVIAVDANGRLLHSPSTTIAFPRVIRVKSSWTRQHRRNVPCSRRNVYVRDKGRCQYCGIKVSAASFQIEHVVPECQGGSSTWENLVISCGPCNTRKGGRTPEQAGMRLMSVPKPPAKNDRRYSFRLDLNGKCRPEWKPFVSWNVDV